MNDLFDPADAGCWIARGRPARHAQAIAEAWRCFPELPHDAPLGARQARTRERVQMLRPLHDAISLETEQQRRAANFAFVECRIAQGSNDTRHAAILHARDLLGYDWDAAHAYADGHYALCAAGHNAYYREVVIMRRSAGHKCKTAIFCHAPSH